jgi:hypothetical protein
MPRTFDLKRSDSQATPVEPITPNAFDLAAYEAYEAALLNRCRAFANSHCGALVYRRMRVAEVFSWGCRDMKASLSMQLGALKKSMEYQADIPNFLEPWYGIGTVAASFGIEYVWHDGQAPAFVPKFNSVEEALACPTVPVKDTPIGQHTLRMIDYFLEETQGRIPMSLCDVQSPLNVGAQVVETGALLMALYDCPDQVAVLLDRIAGLLSEFAQEQTRRIGRALVWPGHGFASSRVFAGFGMSDDNSLMLSPQQYQRFAVPAMLKAAADFGGPVYHSCGNWRHLAPTVRQIPGLRMADGAFGAETDPAPNHPEAFPAVFAGSSIVLNARIVGDCAVVAENTRKLWNPAMKLIVVTYCESPEEQKRAYESVHESCI